MAKRKKQKETAPETWKTPSPARAKKASLQCQELVHKVNCLCKMAAGGEDSQTEIEKAYRELDCDIGGLPTWGRNYVTSYKLLAQYDLESCLFLEPVTEFNPWSGKAAIEKLRVLQGIYMAMFYEFSKIKADEKKEEEAMRRVIDRVNARFRQELQASAAVAYSHAEFRELVRILLLRRAEHPAETNRFLHIEPWPYGGVRLYLGGSGDYGYLWDELSEFDGKPADESVDDIIADLLHEYTTAIHAEDRAHDEETILFGKRVTTN